MWMGSWTAQTMRDVESFLDSNAQARRFVLDAMRTTVLLRAGSNDALHEPVPERLRQIFARPAACIKLLAGDTLSRFEAGGGVRPGGDRRRLGVFL